MNIFPPLLLNRAVTLYRPLLGKISQELRPKSHPEHDAKAEEFMKAVDAYDDRIIDDCIDEAVCYYTHNGESLLGLIDFCDKFGVARPASFVTLIGALQFIAEHRQEISKQLSKVGV